MNDKVRGHQSKQKKWDLPVSCHLFEAEGQLVCYHLSFPCALSNTTLCWLPLLGKIIGLHRNGELFWPPGLTFNWVPADMQQMKGPHHRHSALALIFPRKDLVFYGLLWVELSFMRQCARCWVNCICVCHFSLAPQWTNKKNGKENAVYWIILNHIWE